MISDLTLTVENLDHLGIVAGLVEELGLVEYLNWGTAWRRDISTMIGWVEV